MDSPLFTPISLGPMKLANRFVRSATWEALAGDDGAMTPHLAGLIATLGNGRLGAIISGHAYVGREGQAGPWQLGIYDDRLVPGLAEMVENMRRHGSRAVAQLAHAGGQAVEPLSGMTPIGPSAMAGRCGSRVREMNEADIARVTRAFADAASRARQAGFDAVQIHAAHGFLLSQFLSPYFNHRVDRYGGSLENRARFLLETVEATRSAVGDDRAVLVKINAEDFIDGGFSVDDMVGACLLLERAGVDAVEMSGGTVAEASRFSACRNELAQDPAEEPYYREAARRYKDAVGLPLILVGGIRSFEAAEQIIDQGLADCVALCRPLIAEPGLIARWESGDRAPARCISCNQCFGPASAGEGIRCVIVE
ncbi:MAG: NADH:flavin oxidoreductase [Pirellulales bacterium]|nr:NADH:flavin oxidoreductase [Pirellulales bacterium]